MLLAAQMVVWSSYGWQFLIAAIIIGAVLYVVGQSPGIDATIKMIVKVVCIVLLLIMGLRCLLSMGLF